MLNRRLSLLAVIVFCSTMFFGCCGGYEEGPGLSFRFKETRVAGFWLFSKFEIKHLDTGEIEDKLADSTITDEDAYVEFTKGGIYEVVNEGESKFGAESGVWHMGKGCKGKAYMEVDKNDRLINYYVIKMTNDELKYTFTDRYWGTDEEVEYTIHLVPKIL